MSYTVHITVNLPEDIEYDTERQVTTLPTWINGIVGHDCWTSLVMTITNTDPPKAVKTFVEPI